MGQLIHLSVEGQGQIVVTGDIHQQNFMGGGVHHRQNVGIAAGVEQGIGDALVGAAAIDHERLTGDVGIRGDGVGLVCHVVCIDLTGAGRKILVTVGLLQGGDHAFAQDDGVYFPVVQSVGQSRRGVVGLGLDLPQSLLQMRQKGIGGVGIRLSQIAVGIAEGITDLLSGVVFPDPHHYGLDAAGAGHTGESLQHGVGGHGGVDHARRQYQRHHAQNKLPELVAPAGQLGHGEENVQSRQHRQQEQRQLLGQHAGGQQPGRQKAAGDQQQEEGEYTEPIRPSAAAGGPVAAVGAGGMTSGHRGKTPFRKSARHDRIAHRPKAHSLSIIKRRRQEIQCKRLQICELYGECGGCDDFVIRGFPGGNG